MIVGRILGIDYGIKRCGIAVTDPLQIIVNGLDTVDTNSLMSFLSSYLQVEKVDKIVLGQSSHKDGNETYVMVHVREFARLFSKKWPGIPVDYQDESFSSDHAKNIMIQSGIGKKKRQDKSMVDRISAVIILQRYLKHI